MSKMLTKSCGLFFSCVFALAACSNNSFQGGTNVRKLARATPTPTPNGLPGYSTPDSNNDDSIPVGTKFNKVGVNLNDFGKDQDFNDTVYCFTFDGVLQNGTDIVSTSSQTVSIARTHRAANSHSIILEVKDKNGAVKSSLNDVSGNNQDITLSVTMDMGDKLVVTWVSGSAGNIAMSNTTHFRVLPDQCNTTGR